MIAHSYAKDARAGISDERERLRARNLRACNLLPYAEATITDYRLQGEAIRASRPHAPLYRAP